MSLAMAPIRPKMTRMAEDQHFVVRRHLYDALAKGELVITGVKDGEPLFKLTEKGKKKADKLRAEREAEKPEES
jgi:hypothetical protein